MEIFEVFRANSNAEKAKQMSDYMRGQFCFLGLSSKQRRELSKDFLKGASKQSVDWSFVDLCWAQAEREFQYLAIDYLKKVSCLLSPKDLPKLKGLVINKAWWDTIDALDVVIGDVVLRYPQAEKIMLDWSIADNFWLRRIAIDHQLLRKDKTNTQLLEQVIVNNFGQKEFFINKAIGWSLRQYSKTNPDWVRNFIKKHKESLAPLSIREGSKYI